MERFELLMRREGSRNIERRVVTAPDPAFVIPILEQLPHVNEASLISRGETVCKLRRQGSGSRSYWLVDGPEKKVDQPLREKKRLYSRRSTSAGVSRI